MQLGMVRLGRMGGNSDYVDDVHRAKQLLGRK
jgi:hypothetical protein